MLTQTAVRTATVSFATGCRRFRGVSKHHFQGYLNFLDWILNTDNWFEQILSTDFYR